MIYLIKFNIFRKFPGGLAARIQQYVNRELPNVQFGVRKGRGTRDEV